ncbi:MAG: hypothetical protein K6G72_11250 [Lachnospiraceae bacterium]|nr:hypothetical protein [Lachnospiraceae bacterium]
MAAIHTCTPPINQPHRKNHYCNRASAMAGAGRRAIGVAERASERGGGSEDGSDEIARQTADAGMDAAEAAKNEAVAEMRAIARRKAYQKARIRKQYAAAVRQEEKAGTKATGGATRTTARTAEKAAKEATSLITKISEKIAAGITENPIGAILAALFLLVLLTVISMANSCGIVIGGIASSSVAGTYTAEDSDIYAAEAYYSSRETALRAQINNTQTIFPGYDEYRLPRVTLGHDPWKLASTLTVLYGAYTSDQAKPMLDRLFSAQYEYRAEASTETRYRREERIGYRLVEVFDEDGNVIDSYYEEYTYYIRVPYDYTILTVRTVNHGLDSAVDSLGLDADTMELLNYLTAVKGEKDYLWR